MKSTCGGEKKKGTYGVFGKFLAGGEHHGFNNVVDLGLEPELVLLGLLFLLLLGGIHCK